MQGQKNANQNSDVFRSTAVIQANNDLISNDTHYRSTVEAKIKRSNVMIQLLGAASLIIGALFKTVDKVIDSKGREK